MGKTKPPLWWTLVKYALPFGVLLGIPYLLSTDRSLRWFYEKAYAEKWSRAPKITLFCADYYRWTWRLDRAAATYELFVARWPKHEQLPEAVYECAVSWRDRALELEYEAHGDPVLRARREELRTQAEAWLSWFVMTYPEHPLRLIAERAASNLRCGY